MSHYCVVGSLGIERSHDPGCPSKNNQAFTNAFTTKKSTPVRANPARTVPQRLSRGFFTITPFPISYFQKQKTLSKCFRMADESCPLLDSANPILSASIIPDQIRSPQARVLPSINLAKEPSLVLGCTCWAHVPSVFTYGLSIIQVFLRDPPKLFSAFRPKILLPNSSNVGVA